MIDSLKRIDTDIFLFINRLHNPVLDKVMWLLSHDFFIYPIVMVFLYFLYKKQGVKYTIAVLLTIVLCVGLSDLSSNFVKHRVQRYRPTHHTEIGPQTHTVNGYRGGQFGFYSSHASNTFAVTTILVLLSLNVLKSGRQIVWLYLVPFLISISRIYLGVHYPSDIFTGALIGLLLGYATYKLFLKLSDKLKLE